MRQYKRTAAVVVMTAMVLTLNGCGGGKDPVQTAAQKLLGARSLDSATVLKLNLEVGGRALEADFNMDVTVFTNPVKLMAVVTADMRSGTRTATENETLYAKENETGFRVYRPVDETGWQENHEPAEALSRYAFPKNMTSCILGGMDYQYAGTELLETGNAVRYDGVIQGDKLAEALEPLKVREALAEFLPEETIDSDEWVKAFSAMEDVPVSVWIDAANGYPTRLELETEQVNEILSDRTVQNVALETIPRITSLTVQMSCSGYSTATNFNIPDGKWAD